MNKLKQGEYYGTQNTQSIYNSVIVTDTVYTHDNVDWHRHENPYFTYLLQGGLFEANKKSAYYLQPGNLMFHNWQDAHYNKKSPELTRGFHLELNEKWFNYYTLDIQEVEGSVLISDPIFKQLMNQLFLESKINDCYTSVSIDTILLEIFGRLKHKKTVSDQSPQWLGHLREILLSEPTDLSLLNLAHTLNLHPVHLSRAFSRHFGVTLGTYIRGIKLNKAFHLATSGKQSMTEIGYTCGFADQSHFTRSFKALYGITPSSARKRF